MLPGSSTRSTKRGGSPQSSLFPQRVSWWLQFTVEIMQPWGCHLTSSTSSLKLLGMVGGRTSLLRVSQVPDPHRFRNGKRGALKSLGLGLKVKVDSFHWFSLLQRASLLLLWDDEMSDPQSKGIHDTRVWAEAVWRQRVQGQNGS